MAAARADSATTGTAPATASPAPANTNSGPTSAESAPATIPVPAPVAATLDKLTGGKAKILRAFQAPSGLIGVAITEGGSQNGIIYVSPDGKYVFQGVIIGPDGDNVTQQEASDYLPKPPSAADNFAVLDKTHTYLWGQPSAPKELWIVFDPNCIYCHKTFESLQKYVSDGTVKVNIIQVGFLKKSSLGKAAAILSSKNPVAALTEDETKFDVDAEEGGIAPDTSDAKAVQQVRENNAWMDAQQIDGTPYLLYRNSEGKPEAIGGYVEDVPSLLKKIGTGKG